MSGFIYTDFLSIENILFLVCAFVWLNYFFISWLQEQMIGTDKILSFFDWLFLRQNIVICAITQTAAAIFVINFIRLADSFIYFIIR